MTWASGVISTKIYFMPSQFSFIEILLYARLLVSIKIIPLSFKFTGIEDKLMFYMFWKITGEDNVSMGIGLTYIWQIKPEI